MISVIIPIYKVEAFLDRCVQSVLNQTYRDIEIILVNDGSPDNCPAMCDAWAKQDSRIKVIHKPNGGLSDARNAGLDIATGEYVAFVDSDDYIHPQMYDIMLDAMLRTQSDIVSCRLRQVDEGEDVVFPKHLSPTIIEVVKSKNALEQFHEKYLNLIWMSACTKLYHRSIFATLRFRRGIIFEDLDLFPYIIAEAKHIAIIDQELYCYRTSAQSITHSPFSEKYFDTIEMRGRHMDFFLQMGIVSQTQRAASLYVDSLIQTYQAINKNNKGLQKKFWEYIEQNYRLRRSQIMKYGNIGRMRRAILDTFPCAPALAVKIYNFINK